MRRPPTARHVKPLPPTTREALSDLAQHVVDAADDFPAGTLDVASFDRVMHQYHRATQELWTFCNVGDPRTTVDLIDKGVPIGWWERGAAKRS